MGADDSREGGPFNLLCEAETPALTELSLAGFSSWPRYSFRDLIRFSFAALSSFERDLQLLNGFIELLRNSPLVEALAVSGIGRRTINDLSLLPELPIPLICLSILCVDTFDIPQFLTLVSVSTSTSICALEPLWHKAEDPRTPVHNSWPYSPELHGFDEIRIKEDWDTLTIAGKQKSSSVPSSVVYCCSERAGTGVPDTISSWASLPGVSSIKKLFLHTNIAYAMIPCFSERTWNRMLPALPNLRYIRLTGYDPTDLVTCLLEDINQGLRSELQKIHLEIVEIHRECELAIGASGRIGRPFQLCSVGNQPWRGCFTGAYLMRR